MAKQAEIKTTIGAAQSAVKINNPPEMMPTIYADRVVNAGFGPGVCRLTLAMENGIGVFTPSATLVMPTPALLELMTALLSALQGNAEIKEGMLKGLEAIKAQISALK